MLIINYAFRAAPPYRQTDTDIAIQTKKQEQSAPARARRPASRSLGRPRLAASLLPSVGRIALGNGDVADVVVGHKVYEKGRYRLRETVSVLASVRVRSCAVELSVGRSLSFLQHIFGLVIGSDTAQRVQEMPL